MVWENWCISKLKRCAQHFTMMYTISYRYFGESITLNEIVLETNFMEGLSSLSYFNNLSKQ